MKHTKTVVFRSRAGSQSHATISISGKPCSEDIIGGEICGQEMASGHQSGTAAPSRFAPSPTLHRTAYACGTSESRSEAWCRATTWGYRVQSSTLFDKPTYFLGEKPHVSSVVDITTELRRMLFSATSESHTTPLLKGPRRRDVECSSQNRYLLLTFFSPHSHAYFRPPKRYDPMWYNTTHPQPDRDIR